VIVAWVRINLAAVPRLRNPTRPFGYAQGRQKTARKKKSGCFAPFGLAQGRRDGGRPILAGLVCARLGLLC